MSNLKFRENSNTEFQTMPRVAMAPSIAIDSELSETSTNAVENQAIAKAVNAKQDKGDYATTTQLSEGLAGKQDAGDYVTNDELNQKGYITSIPTEYVTDSELIAKGYATETQLSEGLAGKQDVGDYATKSELYNDAEVRGLINTNTEAIAAINTSLEGVENQINNIDAKII